MSRTGAAALCVLIAAASTAGCDARSRYKALTTFFDGVPPPQAAPAPTSQEAGLPAPGGAVRPVAYRQHGPYAAKLCDACHEAAATNALVVPKDELCFRCHALRLDTKYVHGPLASGGCLVCHDPHSSKYAYLLVSESDSFCFNCHDETSVAKIEGHGDVRESCTVCHNAHGSNKPYLLK